MYFSSLLRYALFLLVPVSFFFSTYLYLYPAFHYCAFPSPEHNANSEYLNTLREHTPFATPNAAQLAPFRLLALGDPQLEGDSSIDDVDAVNLPNLAKFWKDALLLDGTKHNPLQRIRHSLHDLVDFCFDDIPKAFEVYRKRFDHVGNDYYLGHIYRTMHWWTNPTHVTVLGDLVGSQWVDDEEFENRGWRFWNRVFRGGVRVPDEIASEPSDDFQTTMILGEDAAAWKKRIINVAGNHDIGYAGDITPARLERFGRVFGKANYELRFQIPLGSNATDGEDNVIPELRVVVLNDMNLDTPAGSQESQDETYKFLNSIITTSSDVTRPAHFTLLLTHIPMYKEDGVCVDGPFFDFFTDEFANGVKEQNHLSADASNGFLEGIFGMSGDKWTSGNGYGRNGLVLTGHDHEGCDIYHYINQSSPEPKWKATGWNDAKLSPVMEEEWIPGMREITVRSMMGGFAGNAGLMSLWFNVEKWEWEFEFVNCGLGTQHIWWFVHIVDLITFGVGIVYAGLVIAERLLAVSNPKVHQKTDKIRVVGMKPLTNEKLEGTDLSKLSGQLNVPGAGNRSLRKKKSKRHLNGGSPNGSTFS